jgi:N-ethylmaleimide reductase
VTYLLLIKLVWASFGLNFCLSPADFNPIDLLRPVYQGTLLAVGGFERQRGDEAIMNGRTDAVVFGRLFISNPDLVERLRLNAPLTEVDVRGFYGGSGDGYTDYPTLSPLH